MGVKYTYSIINDFPYSKVDTPRLSGEIDDSDITIALDYINTSGDDCDTWFKAELPSADETTLSGIVSSHSGEPLPTIKPPTMADGRPVVRADSRPHDTQTYFTMSGDTVSGIGDGALLLWDFSNDDGICYSSDFENCPTIASGYKAKRMDIWFNEPIFLKDGTLYFQNACFNCYVSMYITVPAGNYYPNDSGSIPAAALGLSGDQMYAYATKDVFYSCYVMRHHMVGDCTMGDELNAEGAQMDALPPGWCITGLIVCPENCNTFRGFSSLELYRNYSVVLPGGTLGGE